MQCNNVTYQNFLSFEYVVATKAVLIMKQQGKPFFLLSVTKLAPSLLTVMQFILKQSEEVWALFGCISCYY